VNGGIDRPEYAAPEAVQREGRTRLFRGSSATD